MNIEIHTRSEQRKAFVMAAATFFAKELNIHKLNFTLDIFPMKGLRERGTRGLAHMEYGGRGTKKMEIHIDSRLPENLLISTLAHEMVHIKQMLRGQYWAFTDDYGTPVRFWLGKQVDAKYIDQPWEIEAWTKERLLSVKYESIIYEFGV